jgi:hypothetical protein
MQDDLLRAVVIPFLQSVITAVIVGGLGWLVCYLTRWPWQAAAILALVVLLGSWLSRVMWWSRLTARALTGEAEAFEPAELQPEPQTINLHISQETEGGYLEGAFLDRLPVDDDTLAELASDVINGRSLTTASITRPGGPLDRASWELLRDRFISAGLLAWRSGSRAHGCEVTSKGLAVFKRLAK